MGQIKSQTARDGYCWQTDDDDWLWIHDTFPMYKESADHDDNKDAFKIHILLEFLNNLKIVRYSKYYDGIYAVYIRRKDGK